MSSLKQGVTEKTINTLKERVKLAELDRFAKFEELSVLCVNKLQERVTVACRQVEPPVSNKEQALLMNVTAGCEQALCSF
jgi:hypothetical protein